MAIFPLHEYRTRYDVDMASEVLQHCFQKKISLLISHEQSDYNARILHYKLDVDDPYVILDSLMPEEGNSLAKSKTEVLVQSPYLHEGVVHHVKYHMILWGAGELKGHPVAYATPPIDIKMATEHYMAKPSRLDPLLLKLPLFEKELELNVARISLTGLLFEDRLVADSLPAVSKLNRIKLVFSDGNEIVVHGSFRGRGNHVVEFDFDELEAGVYKIIESYLQEQFATHGIVRASKNDDKHIERSKAQQIRPVTAILFCVDDTYLQTLKPMIDFDYINVKIIKSTDEMVQTLEHSKSEIVFIDNQIQDLDLWDVMKAYKGQFQKNEKPAPVLVLSDDLSEDALVYAQYCGAKGIVNRNDFSRTFLRHIVATTGRKEIMKTEEGEEEKIKSILIIDDDKNVVPTLQHMLNLHGYQPVVANSGSEGVRLAKDHKPACIVLEIAIRSGDGMNAMRMLKKMPFTAKIPLLILTASRDQGDLQAAKQNKVEAFLKKPMSTESIFNEIKSRIGD